MHGNSRATPSDATLILLVEDDRDTRLFVHRAVKRTGMEACLVEAFDGKEAMAVLRGDAPHGFPMRPDIVLLDFHMPRVGAVELIRWMNNHAELADVPKYVLSYSSRPEDVRAARELGVLEWLEKPPSPEVMARLIGASRKP